MCSKGGNTGLFIYMEGNLFSNVTCECLAVDRTDEGENSMQVQKHIKLYHIQKTVDRELFSTNHVDIFLIFPQNIYSRLSLSRSPRDSLKYFMISVPLHIRFAELRKQ